MVNNPRALQSLYESYKDVEVILNNSVVERTGLQNKIFLRHKEGADKTGLAVILYSLSMNKIKVIAKLKDEEIQEFSRNGNKATLTLLAFDPETDRHESILVKAKLLGISNYPGKHPDLFLLVFELNQTTPALLIARLGEMLKEKEVSAQRGGKRIVLNKTVLLSLNMSSQKANVTISGTDHSFTSILLDLSEGGLKVFVPKEEASAFANPEIVVELPFTDGSTLPLYGRVLRADTLENRDEYVIWAVQLIPERIPTAYVKMLERHLTRQ